MTLTATSFDWVRQLVHRESAIVLAPGKEYLVEARLLPIARQLGLPDVGQFVDSVRSRPSPESTRKIVEALTTNETSWFRDGDPFTALTSTVLPALQAARGPAERLQIWSAACSSGQEAYTIAMLLEDAMPNAGTRVSITATDISREMVERTRAGRFTSWR
jgi:chemotaxis protein methyltransferase CheR